MQFFGVPDAIGSIDLVYVKPGPAVLVGMAVLTDENVAGATVMIAEPVLV